MVKQGTIINIDFNPRIGHEQGGFRPALVLSNDIFNSKTNFAILCPITNTNNNFPLHIPLDERTKTSGFILCEHIKSLDLKHRKYQEIEKIPNDILNKVINLVYAEIENIK